MKKIFWGFLFLLIVAAGCSSEEQDNLVSYFNDDIQPLAPQEEEVVAEYESVTGPNFTDDQTLYDALTESIVPKYEDLVKKAEAIEIDDEEIAEVHDIYLTAANNQLEGFHSIVEALEKQDPSMIEGANQVLTEGFQGMQEYQTALQDLADERNVEIEEAE
ncbi:hypothetical protein JNUCC1_00237 [Lentibacillus sp. JNUCC-1]|uniref:hypothetical protein n=1 Tax=Lentibacillus sp. JNUCC-1 TaxID=2654513 RepID=UPI0012E896A5|nr:hypothetical protein [Lentibacillus sp. JNUCC-1]MUV36435.1 hypothetical protein [Lentibacillus sp. JNUCC-1]